MTSKFRVLFTAAIAVVTLPLLTIPAMAGSPAHQRQAATATSANSFRVGIKIGVWEASHASMGGPALTNAGARTQLQNAQEQLISYGVYDCWTTETCGGGNGDPTHTG